MRASSRFCSPSVARAGREVLDHPERALETAARAQALRETSRVGAKRWAAHPLDFREDTRCRDLAEWHEDARPLRDDPIGVLGSVARLRDAHERDAVEESFVHAVRSHVRDENVRVRQYGRLRNEAPHADIARKRAERRGRGPRGEEKLIAPATSEGVDE